jgi:hypothetical protein
VSLIVRWDKVRSSVADCAVFQCCAKVENGENVKNTVARGGEQVINKALGGLGFSFLNYNSLSRTGVGLMICAHAVDRGRDEL